MTRDDQIVALLEHAASDSEVRPAPIESILRNGNRARQRRRQALVASVCLAVIAVVVAGMGVARLTPDRAAQVTSGSDRASSVQLEQDPFSTPLEGGKVDTNAIHEAAVPLSECPELLAFLTSPEVDEFQRQYFGDPYTPETRFYPDCPDLEYMRARYEAARTRILGEKP